MRQVTEGHIDAHIIGHILSYVYENKGFRYVKLRITGNGSFGIVLLYCKS